MAKKRLLEITPDHREVIMPMRGFDVLDTCGTDTTKQLGSLSTCATFDKPLINGDFTEIMGEAFGFEQAADKVIESARSAHEVGFGRFTKHRLPSERGSTAPKHLLSVAVKPFNNPRAAINEVVGQMRLGELGVETYSPVGVFPTRAGTVAVVSQKRNDLQGLDRDTWVVGRRVETEQNAVDAERNTQTVKDVVGKFAWLHVNRMFHPDGQLKNWGVAPDGTIGTFDTERHVQLAPDDPAIAQFAWRDLDHFVASLVVDRKEGESVYGVGMLHGLCDRQLGAATRELVLEPYEESLVAIAVERPDLEEDATTLLYGVDGRFNTAVTTEKWPGVYGKSHLGHSGSYNRS